MICVGSIATVLVTVDTKEREPSLRDLGHVVSFFVGCHLESMEEPVAFFVLSNAASSLEPLALHFPQFEDSLRDTAAQYVLSC